MNKKIYLTIAVISIILYAAIILDQTAVVGLGELFGYIFYVVIIAGIIATVWLLIKRPQKDGS